MIGSRPQFTLLALAVTAALSACSSSQDNILEHEVLTEALPEPASTSASDTATLQEVVVTGSRIENTGTSSGKMTVAYAERMSAPATRQAEFRTHFSSQMTQSITERYASLVDNGITQVSKAPVSTFSIDVDTGAYSNVRRFLNNGQFPPADAVRTEELLNYFDYQYPVAQNNTPFSISTEIAPSPWHVDRHLVHIGIQAVEPALAAELERNLVFLVDVSGSMQSPDKIELLKTSLKLMSRQLTAQDSIAIVVYAGASGIVLEPTPGNESTIIAAALDRLEAGGGTNGAAGIQLAYALAQQHFKNGGINRVLLATDGDFNVGISDVDELKKLIEQKRKSGISLTTLGFGTGNYNDQLMEQLADAGNGNYAYIDGINEARKVLVDELGSTLQTVAKDVKIQIEFNPAVVSEYRLVGYENRLLATEDFNNDKVDAGEIGAGHTVTALYEISLVGSGGQSIDPLRYGSNSDQNAAAAIIGELAWLKLRYKEPDGVQSKLLERAVRVDDIIPDLNSTSATYRFAAAVAGFSQLLRTNESLGDYDQVVALALTAKGTDDFGYRSEFINLVKTAQVLTVH